MPNSGTHGCIPREDRAGAKGNSQNVTGKELNHLENDLQDDGFTSRKSFLLLSLYSTDQEDASQSIAEGRSWTTQIFFPVLLSSRTRQSMQDMFCKNLGTELASSLLYRTEVRFSLSTIASLFSEICTVESSLGLILNWPKFENFPPSRPLLARPSSRAIPSS